MAAGIVFPNSGLQVLSCCIHLLGVSILSHCISRRVTHAQFPTWASLFDSWPRVCVVLAFVDSWLFVFSSGISVFGIGLESDADNCAAAIYLCIAFYGTSKMLIYLFLIEKVHVVWNPGKPRFQSWVYIICLANVLAFCVPIILMIIGKCSSWQYWRVHLFRADGNCVIGLKHFSSITVLTYDLWINTFLTGMFLTPIVRAKLINPRIRLVAVRTLIASVIGLTVSAVNMAVLTALHGQELGWLCLACCSMDVVINVLALFWITGNRAMSHISSSAGTRDADELRRERPATLNLKGAKSVIISGARTPRTPRSPSSSLPLQRSYADEMPLGTVRHGIMEGFFGSERARVEINVTTQCEVEADNDSAFDIKPAAHQLEPSEDLKDTDVERQ
ncbi:hypothetical protein PENSPDRAFT_685636 [Peniophora sp. CONT]|nr:hypothetical protein PENSPDRAFT_685636 [Peniophora sp. CONT]